MQGANHAITLHHRKFTMKDAESYLPPTGDEDPATEGYYDASTGERHLGQHSGNRWQWHQVRYIYSSHTRARQCMPTAAASLLSTKGSAVDIYCIRDSRWSILTVATQSSWI